MVRHIQRRTRASAGRKRCSRRRVGKHGAEKILEREEYESRGHSPQQGSELQGGSEGSKVTEVRMCRKALRDRGGGGGGGMGLIILVGKA